jgi:transposase
VAAVASSAETRFSISVQPSGWPLFAHAGHGSSSDKWQPLPVAHDWETLTFIAGLRCDALTAAFVIDAPMDRRIFETYVETQLAPTLGPGDVVVLDNLPAHKSAAAKQAVRAMGAWLLFLPPYSPDLNPIEMAFAKLKALLRARAVRTIDALWRASVKSAISLALKSAKTTSPPQATDSLESPTL